MASPTQHEPAADPRLGEGITTFNEGRHWHAHEAWEGLWMELDGDDREFVQGLIMAAALLVHYGRRNPIGVAKHWRNVRQRLPKHAPQRWGVDVEGLLAQLEAYVKNAERGPDAMTLDPAGVQIRHDPPGRS